MRNVLKYVWQLPQNVVGFFLVFIFNRKSTLKVLDKNTNIIYYRCKHVNDCGVSLGKYIVLDLDRKIAEQTLKHEFGHQRQSLYLGPFYLIAIGLPSAIGNLFDRYFHKNWKSSKRYKWYYSQPWEKWADKLGEVERF